MNQANPSSSAHEPAGEPTAQNPQSTSQDSKSVSQSRSARILRYRLLLTIAFVVFALDQATKFWVAAKIPFNPFHAHTAEFDREIIRGFFYLIHVGNTGAAWSMFSGQSVLLALLAASTLIAIYFWRHALGLRSRLSQICFGLLCGGIVGNLVDRLLHGHVIDFIDLHFGSYIYPTFNVADSGICVGVILYVWQSLREGPKDQGTKGPKD